jgi:hypothetical protein
VGVRHADKVLALNEADIDLGGFRWWNVSQVRSPAQFGSSRWG